MKKRNLLLLFALLFGAMFMVACTVSEEPADETTTNEDTHSDDDMDHSDDEGMAADDTDTDTDTDNDEMIDPAACNMDAPAEATEVTLLGWSFPIMDHYADEFSKCDAVENVTVNVQLLESASAKEQANLALSAGDDAYDIVHGANGEIAAWGGPGWVMPLNDMIDKYRDEYNLDDIPDAAWEGATYEGNIYGVPVVANTLHLIYNEEVFNEYELEIPETYDDVIEMCNTVGLDNPDYDVPFTINLSAGWAWEIEFFQMLRAYGGDFLDDDLQPAFAGEEGLNALNKIKEIGDACLGEVGYSLSTNDQEVAVQMGTLPATNMWASRAANMQNEELTDLGDIIKFAPAPRATADGPRAGSAWNDYYMIPAGTSNDPDMIFKMIMESVDEMSQQGAAAVGMATRLSVAEMSGPYVPAANQTIVEGIGIYDKHPAIAIVRAKMGEFLPLVGTGELSPQEALDAAAEAYIEEATAQEFIK